MSKSTHDVPSIPRSEVRDSLTEVFREGARTMLITALNAEVAEYVNQFAHLVDEEGRRLVVRNGYQRERNLQTPIGEIPVERPRVNDRRVDEDGDRCRFTSSILPPYLRKTKSLEELIPWLYLKGISTGDFPEALASLLGEGAPGLSPNTICRLKQRWVEDCRAWRERSLEGRRYVYFWADGIYFNIRLTDDRPCVLVILGATEDGEKEIVAIQDGCRESELSWREVLLDLKSRGLKQGPELAVGDGALGFWKALRKVYPKARQQRCWVHKTANILDKMPKSVQPDAKKKIHEIYNAETRADAEKSFDLFVELYEDRYPKATKCLKKDRDSLLTFYDFPKEHWLHVRTTNPIESTFATVRLRTYKTKGCGTVEACLAMVFKLVESAAKGWRRLRGSKLLADVVQGVEFKDGLKNGAEEVAA